MGICSKIFFLEVGKCLKANLTRKYCLLKSYIFNVDWKSKIDTMEGTFVISPTGDLTLEYLHVKNCEAVKGK
jgi:hypothetical protein